MPSGTIALSVLASLAAQQSDGKQSPLVQIEAKAFNEKTGQLFSENLLDPASRFPGWNLWMLIAPGRPSVGAGDLLVLTKVDTSGANRSRLNEVRISVSAKGKKLKARVFQLYADEGVVQLPLWLEDVTCAGRIKIVATFRGKVTTATFNLFCGE